jgi:hypothetical protein
MRALPIAVLLSLCVATTGSLANATAKVVINGQTVFDMTRSTGMSFDIDNQAPVLGPGESIDFHYTWSVSVSDDGLAHVYNGPENSSFPPNGCVPLHVTDCGPEPSGFEQAKATLQFAYTDLRGIAIPPNAFNISVDGPSFIQLTTASGPLADSFTRTGETIVHIHNDSSSFFRGALPFSTWAAGWTYASAVPEPSTLLTSIAGLIVVVAEVGRRRKNGPLASRGSGLKTRSLVKPRGFWRTA